MSEQIRLVLEVPDRDFDAITPQLAIREVEALLQELPCTLWQTERQTGLRAAQRVLLAVKDQYWKALAWEPVDAAAQS